MKSRLEFPLQRPENQALALNPRLPGKGCRDHCEVEVCLSPIAPSSVTAMSLRLVDKFQRQGIKSRELVTNSVCDAIAHN